MTVFKIRIPKVDKKLKETYTDTELNALLKKPNLKTYGFSEYKIWVFSNYLLGTGNRISTALNLKIEVIDFDSSMIALNHTKNRTAQIIPLSQTLANIMREYLKYRKGEAEDYVFCNTYGNKGVPYPDVENADINRIFKYCRVPQDMQRVFIAYLVSLFIGYIEHPCLVLNGSQGSGKTTMSTFIKALIDPVADNKPSLFPKNDADLALMFRDNYLVAFDNLQTLNARLSDKLCTIVTGITESRRKLYTDDEMVHFDLCQPIILNGIHDIVKREDMLSR